MPKFDLDINGVDDGVAEGYEVWSGPLPTPGVYDGKLKVAQIVVIDPDGTKHSKNAGKNRVKIGVELAGNTGEKAQFNGFTAWGGVNLVDSGKPFINQWLLALTDGSDEEFLAIKKAFYEGGIRVDEKKEHITAIGRWSVESPNGELPIKLSLKHRQFTKTLDDGTKSTRTQVDIAAFLRRDGGSSAGGAVSEDEPAAEPTDDEDYGDDGTYEDADVDMSDAGEFDESVLDAEDEPVQTG
ncbi:hypothetical protein HWB99_gp080 [Mycobacterium phage DrLupo]|uniref:Uncharacterized protein n=1 Tax=Mycobacterium phage DrLupo TaxID=2499037 RepID=A0A3S9UQQ3_9CAUD|nr:hypothetical protein HWB99_gp080 [Mycobacterium phage DrLupo]AZS12616.1 hypothetical protein SEA_DRLUPO_80 [Mycobacterium phage DrLupo]